MEAETAVETPAATTPAETASAIETPAAPPQPDPKTASQFAAIARQERALLTERRKMAEERKAIEKMRADFDAQMKAIAQPPAAPPPPSADPNVRALEEKLKDIEQRRTADVQAFQAEQARSAQQGFLREIESFLTQNPDYEFIGLRGGAPLVYSLIEQDFQRKASDPLIGPEEARKQILSVKEAADAIEKFEEDLAFEKALKTKKWQKRLEAQKVAQTKAETTPAKETPQHAPQPQQRTLTQSLTAETPVRRLVPPDDETRLNRAKAALEAALNRKPA